MSALDKFVDELRAATPANFPAVERLEDCLRTLQLSPDPRAVDECDAMVAITRQRLPLRERLRRLLDFMERPLP